MSTQMTTTDLPQSKHSPQDKPELRGGGQVMAIVPQDIDQAYRLAQAVTGSGLSPEQFKGKPQDALVAILKGAEIGFPPMQALESIAVINGRACVWGDGLIALARRPGHQIKEWVEGDGDTAKAYCEVTRKDTGEVIRREFSAADAQIACLWGKRGPWSSYPKRMLQMRARSWAIRDGLADCLRGIPVAEEVSDYRDADKARDVTPQDVKDQLRAELVGREPEPTPEPDVLPPLEVVDVVDAEINFGAIAEALQDKASLVEPECGAAFWNQNGDNMQLLQMNKPDLYNKVMATLKARTCREQSHG